MKVAAVEKPDGRMATFIDFSKTYNKVDREQL